MKKTVTDPKVFEDLKREVKMGKGRVEITYTNKKGQIVAHESLDAKTYKKSYPKEERIKP